MTEKQSTGTLLEALVVTAARHGIHLSADTLRRDYAMSAGPVPVQRILSIADHVGLKAKSLKLTWADLSRLGKALPAILCLNDGQAVLLERFVADSNPAVVFVRNPLTPDAPPVPLDETRLSSVWSGDAILVKRQYGLRDAEQPFGMMWMVGQVLREGRMFRDVGIAAIILSLLTLAPPLFYMVVVDRVLVHQRLSTLAVLLGGIAFVLVFDTLFGYLRRYLIALATARIDARVSTHIFDRLMGLPIDFFDKNPTGIITYKLGEVRRIRLFLTGQLFSTLLDITTLVVLIPAMFLLSPPLTWFVLIMAFLMCLVVFAYIGPMRRSYFKVIEAEQKKNSLMIESVHGMRTIKSLALEGRKRHEWDIRVAQAVKASTSLQMLANQPQTILAPMEKLIYAGSLGFGAYLAIAQNSPVFAGTLVAFTMIATRATQPFVQLAGMLQQFQEIQGAIAQVSSVINLPPERRNANGVRPALRGQTTFQDVRFRYTGSTSNALDGISFTIEPGSVVGIMGRSGSGKTTITRLLQGLHDGYEGIIKIDGVDLREIDLDHLRSNMGVVLQDSFLFQGTIRENILAGRPDAAPERMIEAARMAGAEEFIERLPRGYETLLKREQATSLGGRNSGWRLPVPCCQIRLSLFSDEATSALDPESEAIISANLRRIAKGRTVIIISHRLASLVDSDQILVLDRGKLVDAGTHPNLLNRCDIYRSLWYQQNHHLSVGGSLEFSS